MNAITCPHAPSCVPCPFRGLAYREQLVRKRDRVAAALAAYPSLAGVAVDDTVGSRDLFGYRNVVKLAVRPRGGGGLRAGVYAPGSHRLVDAVHCAAAVPALGAVVEATLAEAEALGIEAFDERDGTGELRYVVARHGAWQRRVQLVLVTAREDLTRVRALARGVAARRREVAGILHNLNDAPGNVILGRRWSTLRPPAELTERIGFLKLRVSPGSFLQANVWTARRIYETALAQSSLGANDLAIDLFCGVGPLSLHLATQAGQVIGIEEVPGAVADARVNQQRNGLRNVRFEQGRVDDVLPRLREEHGRAAVVSLNPTRKGASAAVLREIAALAPRRILYVSCDADTLVRDLDRLASLGYLPSRVTPFDMLPQTEHVETLAELVPATFSEG